MVEFIFKQLGRTCFKTIVSLFNFKHFSVRADAMRRTLMVTVINEATYKIIKEYYMILKDNNFNLIIFFFFSFQIGNLDTFGLLQCRNSIWLHKFSDGTFTLHYLQSKR